MPLNPFELLARMWCANGSLGWPDKAWDVNQKQKKSRMFTRNLYNKTLEHGPFIDYLPRTMAIFPGFVKLPEGNMWMDVLIKKKRRNFTSNLDFDPAMVVWDLGPFGVFFNNRGCSPPLLELEAYRGCIQIWTYEDQNHPKLVSRTFLQILAPHFLNITQGYRTFW